MRALLVLFSLLLPLSMAHAADKLQVVTSFSILDDITHQIGGEHIQISNMVGPDADAHTYEPTPDDAKALLKAKVIIKNGLGFEPWLDRLVTSTETKATVVTASKGVISHTMDEDGETIPDPHAWHNLANAEIYVSNITKALVAADPANKTAYLRNSQAYLKQIHSLLDEAKACSAPCHRVTAASSPPMTLSVTWARPMASSSSRPRVCPPNVTLRPLKSPR